MSENIHQLNVKRVMAYSLLAFVVSLFSSYVLMKKVFKIKSSLETEYSEVIKSLVDHGEILRNEWPKGFRENAKAEKAPIPSDYIDYAMVDPSGKYLYFTATIPSRTIYAQNTKTTALFRCSLGKNRVEQLVELGLVRADLSPPFLFGRTGALFLKRHTKDTNSDHRVDQDDLSSIWRYIPNEDKKKSKLEKVCELPAGYEMISVARKDRIVAIASTRRSDDIGGFLWSLSKKEKIDIPDEHGLSFCFEDGRYLVLYTGKLDEKGKRFYLYDVNSKKLFPILIQEEFLDQSDISLIHVKGVRGKILYFAKWIGEVEDGESHYYRIYAIDLDKKKVSKDDDDFMIPEPLTPEKSMKFLASTTNKFLFFTNYENNSVSIQIITPTAELEELVNCGKNSSVPQFNRTFEYLTFLKTIDSNNDGKISRISDKSEIWFIHYPRKELTK